MTCKYDLFIVDSDRVSLTNLTNLFKNYPVKIKTFTDPNLAFKDLQQTHPRIVIVDNNIPLLTSRDFIIKMSQYCLFQNSTIVLTTNTLLSQSDEEQLRTLGFNDIMLKPLKIENVMQLLLELGLESNKRAA